MPKVCSGVLREIGEAMSKGNFAIREGGLTVSAGVITDILE